MPASANGSFDVRHGVALRTYFPQRSVTFHDHSTTSSAAGRSNQQKKHGCVSIYTSTENRYCSHYYLFQETDLLHDCCCTAPTSPSAGLIQLKTHVAHANIRTRRNHVAARPNKTHAVAHSHACIFLLASHGLLLHAYKHFRVHIAITQSFAHKDGGWEACPFTHPCDDKNDGKRMFYRSVDYFLAVRNLPLLLTATGVDRSVATAHTAIKSSFSVMS